MTEADSRSVGQDIRRLLWNQNIHYRVLKRPLFDPILGLYLYILLVSFLEVFRSKLVSHSPMPNICPTYPIFPVLITLTVSYEDYRLWGSPPVCGFFKPKFDKFEYVPTPLLTNQSLY